MSRAVFRDLLDRQLIFCLRLLVCVLGLVLFFLIRDRIQIRLPLVRGKSRRRSRWESLNFTCLEISLEFLKAESLELLHLDYRALLPLPSLGWLLWLRRCSLILCLLSNSLLRSRQPGENVVALVDAALRPLLLVASLLTGHLELVLRRLLEACNCLPFLSLRRLLLQFSFLLKLFDKSILILPTF